MPKSNFILHAKASSQHVLLVVENSRPAPPNVAPANKIDCVIMFHAMFLVSSFHIILLLINFAVSLFLFTCSVKDLQSTKIVLFLDHDCIEEGKKVLPIAGLEHTTAQNDQLFSLGT